MTDYTKWEKIAQGLKEEEREEELARAAKAEAVLEARRELEAALERQAVVDAAKRAAKAAHEREVRELKSDRGSRGEAGQSRRESEKERGQEGEEGEEGEVEFVPVDELPEEEQLELDPVEVFLSLPEPLQVAFELRDRQRVVEIFRAMDAGEAETHLRRCILAGLWSAGGDGSGDGSDDGSDDGSGDDKDDVNDGEESEKEGNAN